MTERSRTLFLVVVTLAFCAGTAWLGVWQLHRAAQKEALQSAIEQQGRAMPLPQAELARTAAEAEAQHYRHTTLRGRWLAAQTVFLDNRQMDDRPGFFVVTPLVLAPGDAVVVQRGWVPRAIDNASGHPDVQTPEGEVTVSGRIAPPPSHFFELGSAPPGRIRQNLDMVAYSREIGVALRPLSLQQLDEPGAASVDGLKRDWPAPAVNVFTHYGYAAQWFAMSGLAAGLYVWFQLVRPRQRKRRQ